MLKWDERFLAMAALLASWSKDPSTQTGAVIVRPDKTIASTGYNGFPRQIQDHPALLNDRDAKYPRIIHCEMNAVLSARERLDGYTLYTHPFISCDRCAVHMIQAGIKRCVAPCLPIELVKRWGDTLLLSRALFKEAGVEVVEYPEVSLVAMIDEIREKVDKEWKERMPGCPCNKCQSDRQGKEVTNVNEEMIGRSKWW